MNAFVFWPSGDRERQSRIFAEEVVPAAREALQDPPGGTEAGEGPGRGETARAARAGR